MPSDVTRWAMIGTGGMASVIARDFELTENVDLTTVASRTVEKGKAFADKWGIPTVVTRLDELWAMSDIDIVYVATPHSEHFSMAKMAIEAGKNVVVEKPLAMTAAEARELGRLAQDAGTFLMEAMWTRFNPAIHKAVELVEEGKIGEVRNVVATVGFAFPYDPDDRMWNQALGAGSVLDQGVYPVTLANLFLGRPRSIEARGQLLDSGVDTESTMLLEYADGATALLATSITAFLSMEATISGTEGQIVLDPISWAPPGFTLKAADFSQTRFEAPPEGSGYVPMLRAASNAVLHGYVEHALNPVSESIAILEVLDVVLGRIRKENR